MGGSGYSALSADPALPGVAERLIFTALPGLAILTAPVLSIIAGSLFATGAIHPAAT
jgi:hypothetical protein